MLVSSLIAHRFYSPAQQHIAWAIGNFALDEYNRDFIRELQGVHALVESIQTHFEDADTVRFCLTALGLLACKNRASPTATCVC